MKKYFFLYLIGIACNVVYSQIDTTTFNYEYINLTTEFDVLDSTNIEFGQVTFQINIHEPLLFEKIKIQIIDNLGNEVFNQLKNKSELQDDGSLSNGILTYIVQQLLKTNENYTLKLTATKIGDSGNTIFSKNLIKQ